MNWGGLGGCKNQNWISPSPVRPLACHRVHKHARCVSWGEIRNHTSQRADWIALAIALSAFKILRRNLWCSVFSLERYVPSLRRTENWLHMMTYTSHPPNAAVYKVHSLAHIWSEDWAGSGNLSEIEGYGGGTLGHLISSRSQVTWFSSRSGYRLWGVPT